MSQTPVVYSREQSFALGAEDFWELLGNTDNLNRLVGLPAFSFGDPIENEDGMYRPASMRQFGIRTRWREYPFDWVRGQRHTVLRVFEGGPLVRFWGGLEIEPEGDGCRVRVFAEFMPKPWPGMRLLAWAVAKQNVDKVIKVCAEQARLRQRLEDSGVAAKAVLRPKATGVKTGILQRRMARLLADTPADPTVAGQLGTLLREGSDAEVLRMRPFTLSVQWGLPRDAVLSTLLYATVVGLLELDWELMCPNCRVPKMGFRSFGTVTEEFHCDLCGTNYEADLDRTTELRFSVHPAVRAAEDSVYCIGGPHNGAHILVQQGMRRGEMEAVQATLPGEPLRVRILRLNCTVALEPDTNGAEVIALGFNGSAWSGSPTVRFRPGRVRLELHNSGKGAAVAVVEKVRWDPDACTAARVMAIPEFRSLFSSEVLQPGRQIGIRNLCVLFTDLKGSTALYEKVGDAPAYGQVHRHFDFLVECCAHHGGGIVKTIGDAVMASFPSPAAALRAALEMQTKVDAFNATLGAPEPIVIKVGLHHGPAIAVNANGQMDYFGRTVNIAARIQGLSDGGDIVLTEDEWNALRADPSLTRDLQTMPFAPHPFHAELKGIEGQVALVRLLPRIAQKTKETGIRVVTPPRLFHS